MTGCLSGIGGRTISFRDTHVAIGNGRLSDIKKQQLITDLDRSGRVSVHRQRHVYAGDESKNRSISSAGFHSAPSTIF